MTATRVRRIQSAFAALGLGAICFAGMGCESLRPIVWAGDVKSVDPLKSFVRGQTTKAEVLAALGRPDGGGGLYHDAALASQRETWLYESVQARGERTQLFMMFVYFDDGLFDGYLWFSDYSFLQAGGDGADGGEP